MFVKHDQYTLLFVFQLFLLCHTTDIDITKVEPRGIQCFKHMVRTCDGYLRHMRIS